MENRSAVVVDPEQESLIESPDGTTWEWYCTAPTDLRTQLATEVMSVVPRVEPFMTGHFTQDIYEIQPESLRYEFIHPAIPREKVRVGIPQGNLGSIRRYLHYVNTGTVLNFATHPESNEFGTVLTASLYDDLSLGVTYRRRVFTMVLCDQEYMTLMLRSMQEFEQRKQQWKASIGAAA
jgi:hypothetical protein